MRSLNHVGSRPVSLPLLADDILEFHAARLLLLLSVCGMAGHIDGLTKMAKLDFFARYPDFFEMARAAALANTSGASLWTESNEAVESAMVRHHYGPWDKRYYHVLAHLEAKRLIAVTREGSSYRIALTDLGRERAKALAARQSFTPLIDRMREVKKTFGAKSGTFLKDLIYRLFDAEVRRRVEPARRAAEAGGGAGGSAAHAGYERLRVGRLAPQGRFDRRASRASDRRQGSGPRRSGAGEGGDDVSRLIAWFSCGAASAVVARLCPDAEPVYCDTSASEHPDNMRFLRDVEKWVGRPVTIIRSEKYASVDEVFEQRRYMAGIAGAICTVEMKKVPRFTFQRPDDIHLFGFTADEKKRAERLEALNPELRVRWPLIQRGLTKDACLRMIAAAGIELPAMYRLGFKNNNCIGCVKATSPAYWNDVREHFPETFDLRARQSREIGVRLARLNGKRVFLDDLPPNARQVVNEDLSCGPQCSVPKEAP